MSDTDRRMPFTFGEATHTALVTTYKDGPDNVAIQTFDEDGIPYCRVTTNPPHQLKDGLIVLRDDYEDVIGTTRDALINAGVIELVVPRQQVPIGYTSGTVYRIVI